MAKRKSKSSRKSSQGQKSSGRKSRARGASAQTALPPGPTHEAAALTPAPAMPTATGGVTRDKKTRGGKSTLSTHELLAEVPPPPRAKPAPPRAQPQRPTPTRPPAARQQPARQQAPRPQPAKPANRSAPDAPLSQSQIYETLAALLVPYARKMESEMHPKIGFCLKAKSTRTGRETHFGAVQALPDGVAYHLFPLYGHPDLLENVSPELFNRLRGKTCFHFESLHAGLVAELAQLTHAGFERFLSDGVF